MEAGEEEGFASGSMPGVPLFGGAEADDEDEEYGRRREEERREALRAMGVRMGLGREFGEEDGEGGEGSEWRDSGIGTSREEDGREALRRRGSGREKRDGVGR